MYEKAIELPRLGRLRLKECGYLPTSGVHILSATVSEEAGRWYVSVQVEEEVASPPPATGFPLGVDLGSKNHAKARVILARKYARLAHIRRDALHKGTSLLTHAVLSPEERGSRLAEIAVSLPEPKVKVKARTGQRTQPAEPPTLPEHIARKVKQKQIKAGRNLAPG